VSNAALPTLLNSNMDTYSRADWHDYYHEVLDLIDSGSRVLDVGSGRGGLAAWLVEHRGCAVICIDASPDAVAACRAKGLTAHYTDITMSVLPGAPEYDVILFCSSMESLIDPLSVARRVRTLLTPAGRLIVWLPNFAYIRARLGYLRGKAPKCIGYSASARRLGIRAYDDVQFFTKSTLATMLHEAGYGDLEWKFKRNHPSSNPFLRSIMKISSGLSALPGLRAVRFALSPALCVVARRAPEGTPDGQHDA